MADQPGSPRVSAARPPTKVPTLAESIGGKRGLIDSGLPAVIFVFVNSVVQVWSTRETALRAAMISAIVFGVGLVVLRLARKETLQQAISGFLGLAVAVFFAARSGEARGFFLPGIFINVAYCLAFLGSAVAGWPLIGVIYASLEGWDRSWRQQARLRRAFALASVGWAVVFASKAVVQGALYAMDEPGLLAAARLLMGWPLYIAAGALTLAYVKRARRRAGVEDAPGAVAPA
ncbi:MAG: hypothetical protein JWN88_2662 [Frankiales bacterium]|nr:hypothetical protein [Frankiales bacterium]